MKKLNAGLTRLFALPLIALIIGACSSQELPELDPDQALIRVENDVTDARRVTVFIEDLAGNQVPLGNVERNTAHNFPILAPDYDEDIRLVATTPNDKDRGDHIVSEEFVVDGGFTVNWYLPENELEIAEH